MPINQPPTAKKSREMARVASKNTAPEIAVRRLLHSMGVRFRLHRRDLPGHPDVVLPGKMLAIQIHGCFWHGHDCKRGARIPKTNTEYWVGKVRRNVERDAHTKAALAELGWRTLVIWECQIKDADVMKTIITEFLNG